MNYAEIKTTDIANGEGVRVSLFVSGCTHHCKNCFNSIAWDFDYGKPFTEETKDYLLTALSPDYIAGLSLLGGEPFEPQNQKGLLPFVEAFKKAFPKKTVWCYTGYTYKNGGLLEEERANCKETKKLFSLIDVLVDGRFIEEQKDIRLKFRGSANQRVIDLKRSLSSGSTVLYLT